MRTLNLYIKKRHFVLSRFISFVSLFVGFTVKPRIGRSARSDPLPIYARGIYIVDFCHHRNMFDMAFIRNRRC